MAHRNKERGNEHEREVRAIFEAAGWEAERAYASNGRSLGEREQVDVKARKDGISLRVSCKRRKRLPAYLLDSVQDGIDITVFRQDRGDNHVLIPLEDLLVLLGT